MAHLFFSGLETGDFSEFAATSGSIAVSSTTKQTGGYAASLANAAGYAIPVFPASGVVYSRFSLRVDPTADNTTLWLPHYISNATTAGTGVGIVWIGGTVYVYGLRWNGSAFDFINGSGGSQADAAFPTGEWHDIELVYVKGTGANSVNAMQVDGNWACVHSTGNDTTNMDRTVYGSPASFSGGTVRWDNIAVADGGPMGLQRIIARVPASGTPTYNAWTKSTGSNAYSVWDDIPVQVGDYCSTATASIAQTAKVSSFQSGVDAINATTHRYVTSKVSVFAKNSASGAYASIRRRVEGVDTDTAYTVGTTMGYFETPFWKATTVADLDAAEIGAVTAPVGSVTRTVYDVLIQAIYMAQPTPTGVAATTAVGSPTVRLDSSPAVAGVAATASLGSVSVTRSESAAITGNALTAALGTLAVTRSESATLTGVAATASAGTVSVTQLITAAVTGVAATSSVGTVAVTRSESASVAGVAATGALGTVAARGDVTLTVGSVAATTSVGTVSATGTANAAVTGVALAASVGSVSVTRSESATLTGTSATAALGSVTTTRSESATLTGVSATAALGSVSVGIGVSPPVTGVSAAAAVGSVALTYSASVAVGSVHATAVVDDVVATTADTVLGYVTGVAATVAVNPLYYAGLDITYMLTRPSSDVSAGTWSPSSGGSLYAMIDEVVADDGDEIHSAVDPVSDTCEVKLAAPLIAPVLTTFHKVRYRIGGEAPGVTLDVQLRCGTTLIASWSHPSLPDYQTVEQALTAAQAAAITDYSDLRLRFVATA